MAVTPFPQDGSRERLLAAAKSLMARNGYEHASTAAIARAAGTSESQLVRYFESKAGLLLAVFDDAWRTLNTRFDKTINQSGSALDAIQGVLSQYLNALQAEPELATLMLFEGRRIRYQEGDIQLSHGFLRFESNVMALIEQAQREGSFDAQLNSTALYTGLLGLAEGMLRYRMIQRRKGQPPEYGLEDIRNVFATVLRGLRPEKP